MSDGIALPLKRSFYYTFGMSESTHVNPSSPIVRSNFFIYFLFLLCFSPANVFGQITPDLDRPFGMGDVVLVPGHCVYVGDVPHEITINSNSTPEHTLQGCLASQVGWFGLGAATPGLFFEGLPYPFALPRPISWMPASGSLEFLDFPASAWWGTAASTGAVQLRAFSPAEESIRSISGWGGTGGIWGGQCRYQDDFVSLNGNFRRGKSDDTGATDDFLLLSRAQWFNNDSFTMESGFLGTQQVSNDYWYSFYSSFLFKNRNFQSFRIRPFFQSARQEGETAREFGGMADYLFNLAGIGQAQLGAGMALSYLAATGEESQSDRQYVQTYERIDALGNLAMDLALRMDFSKNQNTRFSLLAGIKYPVGSFAFFGDYAKGVLTADTGDSIRGDFGILYHHDETWLAGIQYVRREIAGTRMNGGRLRIETELKGGPLFLHGITARLEEEALCPENGTFQYDTGGRVQLEVVRDSHLWITGRVLSGRPFYCEIGGDCTVDNIRLFAGAANPGDSNVSWPDADTPLGLVFKFGAEIEL